MNMDSNEPVDVFYHVVFEGRECVQVEVFIMCLDDATYVTILVVLNIYFILFFFFSDSMVTVEMRTVEVILFQVDNGGLN